MVGVTNTAHFNAALWCHRPQSPAHRLTISISKASEMCRLEQVGNFVCTWH
jgi:hypothetical protein